MHAAAAAAAVTHAIKTVAIDSLTLIKISFVYMASNQPHPAFRSYADAVRGTPSVAAASAARSQGVTHHSESPSLDLETIAQIQADEATAMVEKLFPDVRCLPGFNSRSGAAAASELNGAIAKCLKTGKKCALFSVGTYLGAKCATLGSKTDKTLMAILGDVPRTFFDLCPVGVTKVKEFDAAGGRAMFHNVPDAVRRSDDYRKTISGCLQVLLAGVRAVKKAGLTPVIMLLSPDVGTCLRTADCYTELQEELQAEEWLHLPVHPSGARGDPVVWNALRTGLEPVQARIYAIENNCTREEAAAAVGELRYRNHAKVKAFCQEKGVTLTARTPNSFFYCDYDVIHHAWNKLAEVGLTALFATRLWYAIDEVEEFMDGLNILAPLLTHAQLAAVSQLRRAMACGA